MAKLTSVGIVKQALGFNFSTVGKTKTGTVMVRKGYFYRMGQDAQSYAAKVAESLTNAGVNFRIEATGDVFKAFRGGSSVANQSHFYVELTVF